MWWWLACSLEMVEPVAPPAEPPAVAPLLSQPVESWRTRRLTITRHGECRMGCRRFDRAEVEQVLAEGRLVPERTRLDGRCPSHAIEGTTRDGQHARMVFAACERETRLVTAIDLDTDWPCACE